MKHMKLKGVVAALAIAGLTGMVQAAPVTDKMLAQDAGDSWLHANGNWAGHRYSTLKQINKRNFRTRILKMGVLKEQGRQEGVAHRPAMLYSFDKEKYEQEKAGAKARRKRGDQPDQASAHSHGDQYFFSIHHMYRYYYRHLFMAKWNSDKLDCFISK